MQSISPGKEGDALTFRESEGRGRQTASAKAREAAQGTKRMTRPRKAFSFVIETGRQRSIKESSAPHHPPIAFPRFFSESNPFPAHFPPPPPSSSPYHSLRHALPPSSPPITSSLLLPPGHGPSLLLPPRLGSSSRGRRRGKKGGAGGGRDPRPPLLRPYLQPFTLHCPLLFPPSLPPSLPPFLHPLAVVVRSYSK